MNAHILLPEIILSITAALVLIIEFLTPRRLQFTGTVTILGILLALFYDLSMFRNAGVGFFGMVKVGPFDRTFDLVFFIGAILLILLSFDYFVEISGEFYFFILTSLIAMMLLAKSIDLFMIFLSLETLSFSLLGLIGILKQKEFVAEASMKYYLLAAFSSAFFLFGIVLTYVVFQTTNISEISNKLFASGLTGIKPALIVTVVLILVGLAFKVAAIPFHMWTPDVYEGAPAPVVAFISAGPKAAGFAIILKIMLNGYQSHPELWSSIFAYLAVLTMFWGNLAALKTRNLKRMLAYSTIAHAGYVLVAVVSANQQAYAAIVFYMLSYTFMVFGAFSIISMLGDSHSNLEDYAGLSRTSPILAFMMAIFMISLTGIPTTSGFISKFYVFMSAAKTNHIWLVVFGFINGAISAYYYLRVVVFMYMMDTREELAIPYFPFLRSVMWIAVIFIFYLGLFPQKVFEIIISAL